MKATAFIFSVIDAEQDELKCLTSAQLGERAKLLFFGIFIFQQQQVCELSLRVKRRKGETISSATCFAS